jgi:hypothetical protein
MLAGASPVSTGNAEGAGHCGLVHIAIEVDGLGDEIRRYHFSRTRKLFEAYLICPQDLSQLPKYQLWN